MYIFAGLLFVLWLLGEVCHYTAGGAIHLLLISAVIMVLIKINYNRKRAVRCQERARSRQSGSGLGAPRTWDLK
jgi:hypothetical protein